MDNMDNNLVNGTANVNPETTPEAPAAPATPTAQPAIPAQPAQPAIPAQPVYRTQPQPAQPAYRSQPQPNYQTPQGGYAPPTPPQQPTYQAPQPQYNPPQSFSDMPLSVGEWVVTLLVLAIPCVNLIMLFVWGFGDGNKSRANYCKATLIWIAIGIGISILLSLILGAWISNLVNGLSNYSNPSYYNYYCNAISGLF